MLTNEDIIKLNKPFSENQVSVKIQSISKNKNKASLVLYLQHTDVMNRLDEIDPNWINIVVSEGFKDITDFYGNTTKVYYVGMKLSLKECVRENVGEGNDPKGAYSDAVKRCAMLFGIGRYLYDSEVVWVPYDESKDKYKIWTYEDYKKALNRDETRYESSASNSSKEIPSPKPIPSDLGSYVMQSGRQKGSALKDILIENLIGYRTWIQDKIKKGEKMWTTVQEDYNAVCAFLDKFNTSVLQPDFYDGSVPPPADEDIPF